MLDLMKYIKYTHFFLDESNSNSVEAEMAVDADNNQRKLQTGTKKSKFEDVDP